MFNTCLQHVLEKRNNNNNIFSESVYILLQPWV